MFMQKRHIGLGAGMFAAVTLTAAALISSTAAGEIPKPAEPLEMAPDFSGTTSEGETVSLEDFAGQTVVLEWTNHGCPFVQKHYDPSHANMQGLQAAAREDDIAWLTVISSAPGKQGHVSGERADELTEMRGALPQHVILDEEGEIGRAYGARTTPHMYVISPDGELVYRGAIDSIPSARTSDIPRATNYLTAALDALESGRAAEPSRTKAYGCSVKY